jgi:uncharacterized membrane protein YbhN (UPF0104 family)
MLKKSLKYIIPLVFGGVLLYFTFNGFDLKSLWISIGSADYKWIVLSAVPMTFAHLARARRWQLLLHPLNRNPSLYRTFLAVMAGYFANMLVLRLGEVTRCGVLQKTENVPIQEGIGTVLVERVFDLVMLAVVTGIALLVQWDKLSLFFISKLAQKEGSEVYESGMYYLLMMGAGVVVVLALLSWSQRQRLAKIVFVRKTINFLLELWTAALSIRKMDSPIEFMFQTVVIWAGYFFTLHITFFSLSSTAGLGLLPAFLILVIGSFGMVAPVQGGVGAYHFIVSAGLIEIYQLSVGDGLVAATLFHATQTIYTLLIGGICAVIASFLKPKVISK